VIGKTYKFGFGDSAFVVCMSTKTGLGPMRDIDI